MSETMNLYYGSGSHTSFHDGLCGAGRSRHRGSGHYPKEVNPDNSCRSSAPECRGFSSAPLARRRFEGLQSGRSARPGKDLLPYGKSSPLGRKSYEIGSIRTDDVEAPSLHRIIAIASCAIVSNVVIVFEFASNARCATIRFENSAEMLTFDCSSASSSMVPRPEVPATPATA
jgi:hypothetical protein